MMKKTLTALAVSAVISAPAAQAMDFEINEETTFSLYGTIEPKFITETNANGDDEGEFADEDSTLGFAVEHAFDNGVTGFAQAEFAHAADSGSGIDSTDSAFFGLKGDFGKFRIGNFDSVYEDSIIDATEVAEDAEITDEAFSGEDNQIAYYSPQFGGGFSIQTQLRYIGEAEGAVADESGSGFSIVGSYAADIWELHVGYDDTGAEVENNEFADEGTMGVAGIVGLGAFELGAKFAVQNNEDNSPEGDETTFSALRGTYGYGPGKLYAALQDVGPDEGDSRTEVTAGIKHKLYDNLTLWSEYGQFDRVNDEGDSFQVGAIYSF